MDVNIESVGNTSEGPMSPQRHSESTVIDAAHKRMIAISKEVAAINKANLEADAQTSSRAIDILLKCRELSKLRDNNPESYEAFRLSFGKTKTKRGNYNRPGTECREIVALVLRHQTDRRLVSRYGQALAHILTLDFPPTKLREEIEIQGGLNGCAKAHREYEAEMRRLGSPGDVEESRDESPDEVETRDKTWIVTPKVLSLCVVDPQGFATMVDDEIAGRLLIEIYEHKKAKTGSEAD